MNLRDQNLSIEMQGEEVYALHTELLQLGYEIRADETERAYFGEGTLQAVLDFQRKHSLRPTGIVDTRTAHAINVAVETHRAIPERFIVRGQVRHQDETPLSGLAVKAFDVGPRGDTPLGEDAITGRRGEYEIALPSDQVAEIGKRRPDLVVNVFSPEGELLARSPVKTSAADEETIDLVVVPRGEPVPVETFATHIVTSRLLDSETGEPLSGFSLRALDLEAGEDPLDLGVDITNRQGLCRVLFTTAQEVQRGEGDEATERRLRLQILDTQGEQIHQADIRVTLDEQEIVEIRVPVPAPLEPSSPRLEELRERLYQDMPRELLQRLAEQRIESIADIRRAGGLGHLANLPVAMDHPAVSALEAQANLSALSDDLEINATLIRKGFDNVAAIADTPLSEFKQQMAGQLGNPKDNAIHNAAVAQSMWMDNMSVGALANSVNGYEDAMSDVLAEAEPSKPCVCRDCESAVSPLAYLADLLNYALKHVRIEGNKIAIEDLTKRFYQPFAALPASCEEMDNKLLQVRACIEVLRRYLADHNLPVANSAQQKALLKAEDDYRLASYESLLVQLGASSSEIRLAVGGDETSGKALAGKLGIDYKPERLKALALDAKKRTETTLERLFGLVSTEISRYPLSDGLTLKDDHNQIVRWNLTGVEWGLNTDDDGLIYLNLSEQPGSEYVVEFYRNSDRTALVATGHRATANGTVPVTPSHGSGLSGAIEIAYSADSGDIALSAIPALLSWRLQHLREIWRQKDWPINMQSERGRPLVDPDLIDGADLRIEREQNPAYGFWKDRTQELDELAGKLKSMRPNADKPKKWLSLMIADVLGKTPDDLSDLEKQQAKGESITEQLKDMGLDNAAFKYLLQINTLAEADSEITDMEWSEVDDILIQAKKLSYFFKRWMTDEKDKLATPLGALGLSPDYFKVRPTALTGYPAAKPKTLSKWRAALADRLDWEDELEARIDQEKALVNAFWVAIGKAEEATLLPLRDALVLAADATSDDLTTKAKRVSASLLIDTQTDACQQITRISQAIETIQNLLAALRMGQLAKSHPDLTATEEFFQYFDEEWTWMGSYATWRSAMLVFLYPENILIPTLRSHQTPAFQQLVKNLRDNRKLDPEQACREARTYSDYFRDICNLDIEASCHAETTLYEGKCRNRKTLGRRTLFYMFARGRHTNTLYWSVYDPNAVDKDYAQSFWDVVPGLQNITKVVGAHPFLISDKERTICLFVQIYEEGEQKLVLVRYNLELQSWDSEQTELELPDNVVRFDAVLCQRQIDDKPPRILVRDQDTGNTYARMLGPDGSDWEDLDFQELRSFLKNPWGYWKIPAVFDPVLSFQVKRILAAYQPSDTQLVLIADYMPGPFFPAAARLIADSFEYKEVTVCSPLGHDVATEWAWQRQSTDWMNWCAELGKKQTSAVKAWAGSILTSSGKIYAFWRSEPYTYYEGIQINAYGIKSFTYNKCSGLAFMRHIGVHSGPIPQKGDPHFAYQLKGDMGVFHIPLGQIQNQIVEQGSTRIAPFVTQPYNIVEQSSQSEVQKRRKLIETAWWLNDGPPQSNLTYIKEAYFFVPVQLALQLQKGGHYISALDYFRSVYDYTVADDSRTKRKIYFGLVAEEALKGGYQRVQDWLRDPLNPHLIACTRPSTYTRYTVLSIVCCLIEYANAEFTLDTSESLALARTLYETAIALLETGEIKQGLDTCSDRRNRLLIDVVLKHEVPAAWMPDIHYLVAIIGQIPSPELVYTVAGEIDNLLGADASWESRIKDSWAKAEEALHQVGAGSKNIGSSLTNSGKALESAYGTLLKDDQMFGHIKNVGMDAARFSDLSAAPYQSGPMSPGKVAFGYCISPNPIPNALKLQAELNLYKLRTCRNIAGMKRTLDPYAAPTDQISGLPQIGAGGQLVLPGTATIIPTPYRFSFLIERAKQLVNIAQQMEAAMFAALEKYDSEKYSRLKAQQDFLLAGAQVTLQSLRVQEAKNGVKLAELQQERAQLQVDEYARLLTDDLNASENAALFLTGGLSTSYSAIAAGGLVSLLTGNAAAGMLAGEYAVKATESWIKYLEMLASFERRKEDWAFSKSLAEQDVRIGAQQVKIAEDQVRVVGQEHTIALLQKDHAKDIAEFLANKFTNAELYDWISGILEGVYSYFLQEATAVAKLAENQLSFERQTPPPNYIQQDYWEPPSENMVTTTLTAGKTIDRRGLTGSVRLLQDIYQLDQYAIDTDKRKLQLTKTISLAAMSPVEFQRFRETGVITFRTPLELFDRDFPGHYLRLLKLVKTSIIALIPPNLGIHATLSTTAASRAVIGGQIFQEVTVRRDPEMVALTSPLNATGLFDLQQQSEMLLPFEGLGVDTNWEFRMPKTSNPFDYKTIADVLLTIEYTALHSYTYYQQVIQTLEPKVSADRAFSFRHELSDQWYDLHHSELAEAPNLPMVVTWKTRREDFPPNLGSLNIDQVVLYFVRKEGKTFEVPARLRFTTTDGQGQLQTPGGLATSIDGVISTRRGNAGSWIPITGNEPIGEWELSLLNNLSDGREPKQAFKKEELEDILFVITYSGRTPPWPS